MEKFKITLAGLDDQTVPDWVSQEMVNNNIEFVVHECKTKNELAKYCGDADLVWLFGGSEILTANNLDAIPKCGAIIRSGSGTDNVAVSEATKLGILVANTPDATSGNVSDHAIGLLFSIIRQITAQDRRVRQGIWDSDQAYPNWHLKDQTMGLVGFGKSAQMVAKKMIAFEVQLLVYDPYVENKKIIKLGAKKVSLKELLSESDFVSLHCPLTQETNNLISEKELRLMKSKAILINTSRGPVVNEKDLVKALNEGWIAGAGLDVLDPEPPRQNNPILGLDNVVITPHIAGYSDQFLELFWSFSVEAAIDLSKKIWPRSCVNPDVKLRHWKLKKIKRKN